MVKLALQAYTDVHAAIVSVVYNDIMRKLILVIMDGYVTDTKKCIYKSVLGRANKRMA